MAGTYEYNPALIGTEGKDRMRFELGDTMVEGGAETCALCDEEYLAILSLNEGSWKRAKLHCLESICRRFAYEVDTKTGPLSLALTDRAKLWRQDYDALKKEIVDAGTTVPPYGRAPDGCRKPPYFYTGMMENREANTNEKHHVPAPWEPV